MTTAFDRVRVGPLSLKNRIAMSPMTRSRAYGPGRSATELMAIYYAQRATAGLIVTEGTQPSAAGQGYPSTPGLHSAEQVQAWRRVTDAVHDQGGAIFAQLMHTGRIAHPDNGLTATTPLAPSAIRPAGQMFTPTGKQDYPEPAAMSPAQIEETIADFADAARNARDAGFDGVEVHGANGYLLHQFLSSNANQRDDDWGGSPAKRARLTIATVQAVAAAIGADRTALRISPGNPLHDIVEEDYRDTYRLVVEALNPLGLAYLHVLETTAPDFTRELRKAWDGVLMLNPSTPGSTTGPEQLRLIEDGTADVLSFGQLFIANPDLPARLASGAELARPDLTKAYGGDENGYTDYPAADGSVPAV